MGKKGGKPPKGRAKQKQKAQKSSSNTSPGARSFLPTADFSLDDRDDDPRLMYRGFAGAPSRGLSNLDTSIKLRHRAIAFVSAGTSTPVESEPEPEQGHEALIAAVELNDDDDEDLDDDDRDSPEQGETGDDVARVNQQTQQTSHSTLRPSNFVTEVEMDRLSSNTVSMAIDGGGPVPVAQPQPAPLDVDSTAVASANTLHFVIDTEGDSSLAGPANSAGTLPTYRASSPTPSDSSEEVILFRGRDNPRVINDPPASTSTTSIPVRERLPQQSPQVASILSAAIQNTAEIAQPATDSRLKGWSRPSKWDKERQASVQSWAPAPPGSWWRGTKSGTELGQPAQDGIIGGSSAPGIQSSMALADACAEEVKGPEGTVASLQEDWSKTRKQKKDAKRADQADADMESLGVQSNPKYTRRGQRGRKKANRVLRGLKIDDSDPEEAAYQDYMDNLKAQHNARDNEDGTADAAVESVLVQDDDGDVNWVDTEMTAGDSNESDEVIGQDLSDVLADDDDLNASDLESSELEHELESAERELIRAEDALFRDRLITKTDEQVAHLWHKQLEFGIDADELMIDDGDDISVEDGVGDVDAARAGLADMTNLPTSRKIKKLGMQRRGGIKHDLTFPDASALADSVEQYGNDGFDIMDFERPSLRNTKKGRKGRMPPELDALSDEDLRDTVLGTWEADRTKKRIKKAEREQLRAQGMLGAAGRKGKADLGQKYEQGMTMPQVFEELKTFLEDEDLNSRPFPPMDKVDRKALHQVASALNLKSKSVGSGNTRFPVLYKTSRTADVDDVAFGRIVKAASRGFLKNQAWSSKGAKKGVNRAAGGGGGGGGGGGAVAAVGLRHGELVGAGAKEIGRENFGHKLMERMGWSKGMALGKDGEGMLQPVEQMMRIGKAGLG